MFAIGDKIAHPMHGAGVIIGQETKKINGESRAYFILKIQSGDMTVLVPQDSAASIGIRPIIGNEEAERIIASIPALSEEMDSNWNQRYRDNMDKIKSGDLLAVAQVIKGLIARDTGKGLSTGERKMLRTAKQIFMSELVLAMELTVEEIEARINSYLLK